jgi:CheY-like chemotaxis protein
MTAWASEKRILIVEDEPDARDFLSSAIEGAGFAVETAVDGVEALDRIKAKKPDLMALGMVMPRHSGITLMRKLSRNAEWADIPIIVIMSHPQDEFVSEVAEELEAFKAECRRACILENPVTPASLVTAISEILERGEA